jgi:lipopolysaccharide transport system permease protein
MEKSTVKNLKVQSQEEWTEVIEPHKPWWQLNLGELWRYRDLVVLLVRRDFVAQYKQTILGPLWHIITPLLSTLIYTIVFGNIARLPTDGIPPFLFYLCGTTFWSYFAKCLTSTADTFVANQHIFSKVYFPRLVMPVSQVISAGIGFAIQLGLFWLFALYAFVQGAPIHLSWAVSLFPLLVLLMVMLGLGMGIIVSAMTTKYHDLRHVVSFGVQLLMYATPVIYPLSMVPSKWQKWLLFNPLTSLMEAFRLAFLGEGFFDIYWFVYSALACLLVLIVGMIGFNRVEKVFVDTV